MGVEDVPYVIPGDFAKIVVTKYFLGLRVAKVSFSQEWQAKQANDLIEHGCLSPTQAASVVKKMMAEVKRVLERI